MSDTPKRRPVLFRAAQLLFRSFVILLGLSIFLLLPHSPLPDHWHPLRDLRVAAPLTPVTKIQMQRALADGALCRQVLNQYQSDFSQMDDHLVDDNCHIADRGRLSRVGPVAVDPVETRCQTALRLAMWAEHDIQPAAREILGTDVSRIMQIGSYNCRRMRTGNAGEERWSSHATADAIDITGFHLADGRRLTLINDWDGNNPEAQFLQQIGQGSCRWFRVSLGPNYTRLHADHFHLQGPGWGFCR
jgi:hypothetical protein